MSDPDLYRRLARLEALAETLRTVDRRRPVAVLYRSDAGQSIPNTTTTIIDFEDQVLDDDGLVTTGASWAFTTPLSGVYLVSASALFATTTAWALGERGLLLAYRNGALQRSFARIDSINSAVTSQLMHLYGTLLLTLVAGDTVDIRISQNTGGALALNTDSSFTYVSIVKVN